LGNYRSSLDIIADILQVASQNARKTQIMYQANLSYKVLIRYLRKVSEASLIDFDREMQYYVLTDKGREFLEAYKDFDRTNKSLEKYLNDASSKKKTLEKLCSSR
jgi:predicted transcriptional regulator